MNYVFVIDETKKQLDPCHPSVARKLLKNQKAAVFRRYPFTIILKKIVDNQPQPIELKIDPGSKTTGLALVSNSQVVWGAELTHRGNQIKSDLDNRRTIRRNRRNRKTRYRSCRNHNRIRVKGWLPPSLEHRVLTTITWVKRLMKVCSVKVIFQELVRFDTQQLQNPEIDGVEYQQGTLLGYEVREYLLEKWSRQCSYCGIKEVPLQIEHIKPKSKGGSNRVSNLCLACKKCNKKKGTLAIEEFLKNKPELLKTILHIVKKPLKDAAAVNATRWALYHQLKQTGLQITKGSGGQTKYNRMRLGLEKSHWVDAACVGGVENLQFKTKQPLLIKSCGYGSRQMTRVNKYGFPCAQAKQKPFGGWKTGDLVKLMTKKGEVFTHRLLATSNPCSFEIRINGKRIKANPKTNTLIKIHARDGYCYQF